MENKIELEASDGGKFEGFLSLPSILPAPGLIVLPEVFNTNEHIRSVASGYAEEGYVVIAPDIYWREEAQTYLPYTDEGRAKAQSLRMAIDTDCFTNDLADVINTLRWRDEVTGKVGVLGFCLCGKFTYLSSVRHDIDAAVSYYGVQIDEYLDEAHALNCPLLLHFAENDFHVPDTSVATIRAHIGSLENVEIQVYPGTEHGFNRYGHDPYDEKQARVARQRTLAHLAEYLR